MLKSGLVTLTLAALFTGSASAQTTASVDPTAAPISAVYSPCKTVADNPEIADSESGICVTAASQFVASLANAPADERDQAIADAVVAIVQLAIDDEACNAFDDEIAAAVRLLAAQSTDPEQKTRISDIATSVDECTAGATAAIGAPPAQTPPGVPPGGPTGAGPVGGGNNISGV